MIDRKSLMLFILLLLLLNCVKSSEIQCEIKESYVDAFILNCSLITTTLNTNIISSGAGGDTLKIGFDKLWKTPWNTNDFMNTDIFQVLLLKSCHISDLGEYAFKNLNNLKRLDLSLNKLTSINESIFKNFQNILLEIDLSSNLFNKIPINIFQMNCFQSLEVFKFNDNKISGALMETDFSSLKNLKHLELNNCHIKNIDVNALVNLRSLEYLSLINNYLMYLNENIFKNLINLKYLYLHDNLFVCDCNLRWLKTYLKTLEMYTTAQSELDLLKCDQPNSLRNTRHSLLSINSDSFICDVKINSLIVENPKYDIDDDVVIVCDVYADPEPSIYWSFGNKRIEKALNEVEKYHLSERVINQTNKISELKINKLEASDLGVYTCTGEISGSVKRQNIKFIINNSDLIMKSLNISMSNWTLILLIAVVISICIFLLSVILFVCWKYTNMNKSKNKNINMFLPKLKFSQNNNEDMLQMSCVDVIDGDGLLINNNNSNQYDPTSCRQINDYVSNIKPKYMKLSDNHNNATNELKVFPMTIHYEHVNSNSCNYASVEMDEINNRSSNSVTSLDEEDLNDLKDFEDFTLDNLDRAPIQK